MNGSMSRQCSQCGEKLPEGAAFCPRDGTRVEKAEPFPEPAVTVRRNVGSGRGVSVPWSNSSSSAPGTDSVPEDANQAWEATVARDVLVGKQLDGYVVKRRVGDGGMGIVYEGEHPVIGRKVAIKILRPGLTEGNGARDLIAEARAASSSSISAMTSASGMGARWEMILLSGVPSRNSITMYWPMPFRVPKPKMSMMPRWRMAPVSYTHLTLPTILLV